MEITNITSSVGTPSKPPTHVRTVLKADVDPGYVLASGMLPFLHEDHEYTILTTFSPQCSHDRGERFVSSTFTI